MKRLVAGLVLMAAGACLAQFPLVRAFELRPGQQRPRIQAIAEDGRGLVWAASDIGLLRADGHSTELILRAEGITAIAAQGASAIVATAAGAIVRCDGLRCDTLLADTAFAAARVRHLVAMADGALWIGTASAGLHRLREGRLRSWSTADGLPDNHVNGLAALRDGRLAVATDQGVVLLAGDAVAERMSEQEGAPDNLVLSVAAADGSIWAGTDNGGVFRWAPGQAPERIAHPWGFGAVEHLALAGGMLWAVARDAGLLAIDLGLSRGIYRSADKTLRAPRSLLAAADGALWWCDGTDALRRADPAILLVAEHEGLDLRGITALCIDGRDRLWFAKGHRLYRHDARFSEESIAEEVKVPVDSLTPIVSLAAARDGTVWAATFGSGVIAIGADGAVQRFNVRDGLSNDNVLRARAEGEAVLFATLEGITVKDAAGFRKAGGEAGFVFDAIADRGGYLMATDGRGVRYERQGSAGCASAAGRTYYALLRGADGRIWAAGPGTGFCAIGEQGEACHAPDAPPFDGDLYALAEAGGRLIAFGSTGILAFDPRTLATNEAGRAFGLEGATAELGVAANDARGALWLGCSEGLLRLQPQARHFAQHAPAFITAVLLNGQPVAPSGPIEAPHDRSALVVRFAAPHWTDPEALRFQYRLVGFSDRIAETRDREAAFPELPPGRYAFQVRAIIGDAPAGPEWSELAITIHPPWWRRPWALALFAVAVVAAAALLLRARERRIRFRQRMEQEKVRFELEALRSQVDPHFLFNSFNALVELIESEPAKAVEHVEQLSTFFRNILQVRDMERIALGEELRLLGTYFALEQRRFGEAIRLEVDVDAAAQQRGIVPLTLQLLVENAIKHNVIAGQGPFTIAVIAREGWLEVANPLRPRATPPRSTGFGLDSIRRRYAVLTRQPIAVRQADGRFTVRIPLLDAAP